MRKDNNTQVCAAFAYVTDSQCNGKLTCLASLAHVLTLCCAPHSSQRTMEIWGFAATFAIKYLLLRAKWTYGKTGMTPDAVAARKRTLAVWLREGLVKLGPTFIKIGQQFSTRVDVLSPEFVKELEKLQDNVPPFDTMTALQILESNLGAPPSEVRAELTGSGRVVHCSMPQPGQHVHG